ncbi:unannotated protein [freshwater metagenome]|uniref:Unannotated protein n=1 Tax=freshwater metagenome TaxID=449393 RepID=A0A6J5Z613_9ZZZZ
MVPTLAPRDKILVHYGAHWGVGDIVLVSQGLRTDVKRVTQVTGQEVWVEGDNALVSIDSRQYGSIAIEQVVAKAIVRLPNLRWKFGSRTKQ